MKGIGLGGHSIHTLDCSKHHNVLKRAAISHDLQGVNGGGTTRGPDPHRLLIQQDRTSLPHSLIEAVGLEHLGKYGVRLLQGVNLTGS